MRALLLGLFLLFAMPAAPANGWEFLGTDRAVIDAGTRKCFPGQDRATSERLRR